MTKRKNVLIFSIFSANLNKLPFHGDSYANTYIYRPILPKLAEYNNMIFSYTYTYENMNCCLYKILFCKVSAMVGNIRNMSNDMNTALVRQNQTLDRINDKAASDITRVKMANERAAALMK